MDVDDENTQAGMSAHTFLRNAVTEARYDGSLCVRCLCSSNQALDAEESEAESQLPEDMEDMLFAEEETEGSDDELGAHRAGALPASGVPERAELDHLDSFERPTEEVFGADPGMLKRPAGRSPRPNECCGGFQGVACRFCPVRPGMPAGVYRKKDMPYCMFCKKELMEATVQDGGRRGVLTRALKKFLAVDRGIFDMALQRVQLFLGEEAAEDYQKKAGGKPRTEAGWEEALEHRQLLGRPPTRKQKEEYDEAVRRDQRVARRKLFFPEKLMARASEEQENQEKATMEELCGPASSVAPMTATYRVQVHRRQGCWKIIARNVPACAHALCAPWIFGASTKLRCRPTSAPLADMESTCHSPKMFLRPYGI